MEQLFIKKEEIEKVATMFLDRNSTTWVKSIITEFLTEYPELQNQQIGVTWKKKDTSKGYAIGSIKIFGGSVPIIANNYEVSPFDVIMFGNVAIPLTKETVKELLSNNNAFRGATSVIPKTSLELFGDGPVQFSPITTRGTQDTYEGITREAIKVSSFIDRIEHVDKESVQNIFTEIKENDLLSSFEKNNTVDVLEKLSSRQYISKETELESYLRNLEINRQFIYEDKDGNKFIKQANADVDYTWTIPLEGSENLQNVINEQNYAEIPETEQKSVIKDLKLGERGIFVDNDKKSAPVEVLDIKKKEKLEKVAFLSGIDSNFGLFVHTNGNYCAIPHELVKNAHFNTNLVGSAPEMGDYGIFIIGNKTTKPFTVVGLQKTADYYEVKGQNLDGIIKYYPIRVKNTELWPKEGEKLAYYVPKNAFFIKLKNEIDYTPEIEKLANASSIEDGIEITVLENLLPKKYIVKDNIESDFDKGYIAKTASFIEENEQKIAYAFNPKYVVKKSFYDDFIIKGKGLNKQASLNDTLWTLIHWGANKSDIEKVSKLKINEEYEITNSLHKPIDVKTIESKVNAEYENFVKKSSISKLLVKEAAVLKDKTTVDAVLSLGLIKKYNILEYLQLIPDYERVLGELAKLLIMVRLGLANIPETVIKTAMEALTTTVILLKQLLKVNK